MISFPQISKSDLGYIRFRTRSHTAHNRQMTLKRIIYKVTFGSYRINSINHKIKLSTIQQFRNAFIFQIFRQHIQFQIGIDIFETLCQYFRLRPSQCGMQSRQLAVDIAWLHRVGIHNRHLSHTGTTNHFGSIRSYSSQTHNKHMRISQT